NAFIIQPELKEKFKDKIKTMKSELYNKLKTIDKKEYKALYCMLSNEESALKNFADRIYSVDGDNVSFADICKILMTDYNMQNQEKKNIESMEQKKKNKGKDENYKHFPLLLHKVLKELFIEYLKQTHELEFLRNNICIKSDVTMESFESQIKGVEIYKDLKEKIDKNNSLLDWYVIAHFLMPKQLNHLIGNIKNYIQFATNIDKRAESVKNLTESGMVKKIQYYDDIVRTLEFSAQYIGKISNNINDYFNSEDEYVSFLSKYVGFINDKSEDVLTELKDFCREKINNSSQIIGIYYGGDNVIINRNVIYAQMYSNAEVFSNIYKKVTKNDIINYYEKQNDLKDVFKSGVCQNEGEQRSLCEFQQLKNRIELTELSTYADMVNDFMAQFVEWAYLRERDLMYFQLGIHYIRLFYSDNVLDEKYHKLRDNVIDIEEGALLYQIVAMYDYELRIFETDNSGNAKRIGQGGPGKSIPVFLKKYCNGTDVYECGLELFEDINQHEHIIRFRNDIAHMRYMSNQAMNIMSIVSNIYKSFFVYDTKLKKSISLVFKNILMRYGVIADLVFSYNNKNQSIKDDMDINIINIKNLKSDKYVYKIVNEDIVKQVEIEIRNQVFLEQLHKLLYFSR
ncbi:MAG: type VI-A CRISPR-associated RNA-guided ribonuclease Cas13a, partial [Eubacterium sp.]|nr:type VI-A CRISPR-associated RNA-guided ribonuclease Cas13a [Eubacterium sp.]